MSASRRAPEFLAAARPEEGVEALAAKRGAPGERPALRKDLIIRRLVQMGEVNWVVKCPDPVQYYTFEEPQWGLIELFDGTRTRTEILETYQAMFPEDDIDMSLIADYEEMLRKMNMIEQSVAEKSLALLGRLKNARQRAAEEKAEGFNIFFLLFHVLDPDRFLNRTVRYVRWLWSPPVIAFSCVCFAWTLGIIVGHWVPIWTGTRELYAFLSKPLIDVIQFFFILTCIGCIHEFAHAYVTKMYGGEVHDIGIALLYFAPAFYCDTTDSVLFDSKWDQLWVTTAGIYIEAWICTIATALWVASYPDTLINEIAFKTMLYTGVSTVFFNINPLIKIDGYYALSSLLEMSELREESFQYLGAWFQRKVLRLGVEIPAASRRKRRIYWIYGTLALAYIGVIMAFIGGLFYNFYAKYFPNGAIVLLAFTLYRLFRKRVRLVLRTGRLFYLDKKEFLMSRRSHLPLLTAAALLALLLFVPWFRTTIEAPATLEPFAEVQLEAPEDATVAEVMVHTGDSVAAGQVLLRLQSRAAEAKPNELAAIRERYVGNAGGALARGEPLAAYQATQMGTAAEAALQSSIAMADRLNVQSPIAGQVLTPRLWDSLGHSVTRGATLVEVGDCTKVSAELAVSERLLDELRVGAPVSVQLRASPLHPIRGSVSSISPATLSRAAEASGAVSSGAASRPDQFVVLAVFDNPGGGLRPGMVGKAKIYGRRLPYAFRIFRVLRRWLQTIFWR